MIKLKDIVLDILNEGIKLKDVKVKWIKDNPGLTDAQMDYYWNKINAYNNDKSGKDKVNLLKTPFSDIEKIVDSSFSKETSSIKKQDTNYKEYADENGLIVYNQNNMFISRGDTKESCVILGKGEKWCISRDGLSNMYHGYKYGLEYPTFYFSYDDDKLLKNKNDINGILVIMVMKDGSYKVADRKNLINSGSKKVDWNYISKLQPKLKGIRSVFKYVEVPDEEKERYEKVKGINELGDDEKIDAYKKLDFDDESLYIEVNGYLESEMFWVTHPKLQEKYINMGGSLSYEDMVKLSDKLKKVLNNTISLKIDRKFQISRDEFDYLVKNNLEEILKKYVNKTNNLEDYEFESLVENNRTYIIRIYLYEKIKKNKELENYELEYLNKNKLNYVNIMAIYLYEKIKKNKELKDYEFDYLVINKLRFLIIGYLKREIEIGKNLTLNKFKYLVDNNETDILKNYLNKILEKKWSFDDYELEYFKKNEPHILKNYLNKRIEKGDIFKDFEFDYLVENNPKDIVMEYINKRIEIGKAFWALKDYEFKYLVENNPKDIVINYINKRIEEGNKYFGLEYYEFEYLVYNNKTDIIKNYINKQIEKGKDLHSWEEEYLKKNK